MACSAPDVVVVHEPSVERSDRADKRLRAPPVVLRALSRAATTTTGSSSSSGGGGGDLHVVSASCCLLTCEQTEYSLSSLSSVRCVSRCLSCLSRACLGQMLIFSINRYKSSDKTNPAPAAAGRY